MKSTVLAGTLVASLVSTLHADVFVLGASWRERSIATDEDGAIERKMRNNAAPRGYFIMEKGTAPALIGAFIQYDTKAKNYTITTGFTNFTADIVDDQPGASTRIFGQAFAPVKTANVPNATMSFSGSTFGGTHPNRVTFDREVFQSGASTAIAGPNLVNPGSMARSILVGTGTNVKVESLTAAAAINELVGRFQPANEWTRNSVAPVIVTEPAATLARDGFQTALLQVTLGADVFPAPSYQWLKGPAPAGPFTTVGTGTNFTVPAGTAGDGTYHVVVSTAAGSDSSGFTVVTTNNVAMAFTPTGNLPTTLAVKFAETSVLTPVVIPNAFPQVAGYQWQKAPTATPTAFTNITAGNGGTQPTFTVTGNNAAANGPGVYRVIISNAATPTPATLTSQATSVTTAP